MFLHFFEGIFRTPVRLAATFFRALDGQQLLVVESSPVLCMIDLDDLWPYTSHLRARVKNNNSPIWGGSVLTGEEPPPHSGDLTGGSVLTGDGPPPHSGDLTHALTQVGGPTQSELSRPMSSRHHISMEHRLQKKHLLLNLRTNQCEKRHVFRKRTTKKKHIFQEKQKNRGKSKKERNEKRKKGETRKRGLKGVPPETLAEKCCAKMRTSLTWGHQQAEP